MTLTTNPSGPRQWYHSRIAAVAAASILAVVLPVTAQAAESGSWTDTGSLTTPRYSHTSSRLADDRVLVVGGIRSQIENGSLRLSTLTSAELYDSATGSWEPTGSLSTPRSAATSTTLVDGRVLVAGGRNGLAGGEQTSTEIYDPETGTWSAGASMAFPRAENLGARLADGRVLVAGQRNVATEGNRTPTAEVYDPEANEWVTTGPTGVTSGCCNPQGVLLPDGRVLTTLGTSNQWNLIGGGPTVYDPSTNSWSRLPAAPEFLGTPRSRCCRPGTCCSPVGGPVTSGPTRGRPTSWRNSTR